MAQILKASARNHLNNEDMRKRYIRLEEVSNIFNICDEEALIFASAADSIYQLPRTTLVCYTKLEEYMKHLYKVPNTTKYVEKKYVRIGEGSIIYSVGRNRFIEMARAAGAVYKINEGTGGTVLVSLDIFDEYMEEFRQDKVEMKNPLWKKEE